MYAVVVQNENLVVEKVIRCGTMIEVQTVLETLEPDMDAEYLVSGEASCLTFFNSSSGDNKTYSFLKLENANCLLANQV
jgi:hypothetical protein